MEDSGSALNRGTEAAARGWQGWLATPFRLRLTCENLAWLAVGLGVVLRVWEYLDRRPLYIDETALLNNIVGLGVLDFHEILQGDQMAPPGFLAIERLLVCVPLDVKLTARFFPLVCGVASVFLMRTAAWRYLDRRAVPWAVALFALGDHLLYYSAEIKQYSCDLVLAIAALVLAATRPAGKPGRGHDALLAGFGLAAPWFSFTVAYVLAGVGLLRIVTAARERQWRPAALAAGMSLAWLISFMGCFLLSRSIMSRRNFLWVWWNFAFLPLPPRSYAELSLVAESIANVFINPASILAPLALPYTALLASLLALIGCVSLGRRWPGGLWLLIAPLVIALAASGLHLYPFHGRLLMVLVPAYLMLLAEGIAAAGRRTGWLVPLILGGCFLYGEGAEVLWHRAIQPRIRAFDSHGDLKNDLLDYLELRQTPNPGLRKRQAHDADSGERAP